MEFAMSVKGMRAQLKMNVYTVPFIYKYIANIWFSRAKDTKGFLIRFLWFVFILRIQFYAVKMEAPEPVGAC